jgi:secreted trypsin-like serine protease
MSSKRIFLYFVIVQCVIIALAQECGIVKYSSELIFGGDYAKKGQWPWLCTLHDVESEEFFCGSTLISNRHVLTGELQNFVVHQKSFKH